MSEPDCQLPALFQVRYYTLQMDICISERERERGRRKRGRRKEREKREREKNEREKKEKERTINWISTSVTTE